MTSAPKAAHTYAGSVVRISRALVSFKKHAAGKMYASAVAETPPVISSVTPRSQVMSDTVVMSAFQTAEKVDGVEVCALSIAAKRMAEVKKMCRCMLKASCEKKYCSITCGGPTSSSRRARPSRGEMNVPHDIRRALVGA
jgi:hypothetical protein